MSKIALKMARALKCGGDVYTLTDIVNRIRTGAMQSFVNGEAWAITTVHDFPRKRVLHIDYAVGTIEGLRNVFDEMYEFAKANDVQLMRAIGRNGWEPFAVKDGWKSSAQVFIKEM